jgi:hypothetical protein
MNKIKSFFVGVSLLMAVFAMVVLASLVYRACERSSVKSYIFQMENNSNQRVGTLQNLDDMSNSDLRNKLIKKYVSEYFKVIPGDKNIENRPTLKTMSGVNAFNYWKSNEARTISEMSDKKMFRIVRVRDDGIALYNKIDNGDTDKEPESVYYKVRYYTSTWTESNMLGKEPLYDQGTMYLEIKFEPGLRKTIDGKNYDIRKYLESGKNPAGLFKFRVINIEDSVKK